MKSQFLLMGVGCILCAIVCAYLSLPATPESFQAMNPVVDLGELEQGQTVHATYELVNHFRQPLTITNVMESCGCTKVIVDRKHFGPGDKGGVKLVWNTGNGRGPSEIAASISYALNDGRNNQTSLKLTGTVVPDVIYVPRRLVFQAATPGKQRLQLRPGRLAAVSVEIARVSHRALRATFVPEEMAVDIEFDPALWKRGGYFVPHLSVKTNSTREPLLSVDLRVEESPTTPGEAS